MLQNMKKILSKKKVTGNNITESGHNVDYGSIDVTGFQMHSEISSLASNFDPTDKKRHDSDSLNGSIDNYLSIDDAVERLGVGRFQTLALIATGLCFMADSMEISLLAFLTFTLKDEWNLSSTQAASITSFVFIGEFIGTLVLGRLGDKYGRRPIFMLAAITISSFGILTAFANDILILLVLRFLVGFGVGGLTVPFDIFAEFLPLSIRGKYLLLINYFWTAGSVLVTLFAYLTIGTGKNESWRSFVVLCTIPCFLSTLVSYFCVPESPRWLLSQGRKKEALDILKYAANKNGFPEVYNDNVELKEEIVESSSFSELLTPKWRKITILLWAVWFGFGFSYNGIVMAITRVFKSNATTQTESISFDFGAIAISSLAESIGVFFAVLTVDSVGRIKSQVWYFALAGVAGVAMLWLPQSAGQFLALRTFFALAARCFEISANCITWITAAELLKTEIRTTGHSAANAACRVGAVFTSYAVEGDLSLFNLGILMAIIHIMTAVCCAYLPETKDLALGKISFE